MYNYAKRKLAKLSENYVKDEFVKLYAMVIRKRSEQSNDDLVKIAKLFTDFTTAQREKEKEASIPKRELVEERSVDKNYTDKNDKNQLNWGGVRASSRVPSHLMRTPPMFFRRDGAPVDIIDNYKGSSIFIINNGPSFKDVDHSKLKLPGILTYGINNGSHIFRPNFWSCVDDPSRFLRSIWADPTITKIVPQAHFEKPIWDKKRDNFSNEIVGDFPNIIGFRRNEKFDIDKWLFEDTINWGNHKDNGGGRSIMVAVLRICQLMGFKNVYLLGCDFEMSEDNKYWFDEQRTKSAINNNNTSYRKMTEYFELLQPKFKEIGFNVYNLNPDSKLKTFEFKDFDECIEEARVDDSESTHGMYVKREAKIGNAISIKEPEKKIIKEPKVEILPPVKKPGCGRLTKKPNSGDLTKKPGCGKLTKKISGDIIDVF